MAMKVICAWCGQWMAQKSSDNNAGESELVSHSICPPCKKKVLDEIKQYSKQTTTIHEKDLIERRL